MTTRAPETTPVHDRVACDIEDRAGARGMRQPLPLLAGLGFAVSWLAGLSVFSASTQVRSAGTQILHAYAGHTGAVAVQYLLTEGLPAVFLAVVTLSLAGAVHAAARATRTITRLAGVTAASVSVVQLALGLWLCLVLVHRSETDTIGSVYRAINRLDGVKMLLLAALAATVVRAIHRRDVALPGWLSWTAAALATTITLSALGYLILDNTLATAAWLSLPCLIAFITGIALVLHRRS